MELLENIPVEIEAEEVKKKLRLDSVETAHALIQTAQTHIQARAVYRVSYIDQKLPDVVQLDGVRFNSRVLRKNLDKIERAFPYVVTIGPALENAASACEDLLDQYYLDEIGNFAVVGARKQLERYLRENFGLAKISKMSPGSLKDWPINEQKKLFSILGDVESSLGVKLTPSFLMIPRKSLSGIYFPTEIPFLSCQLCPRESCPSRQAAFDRKLLEKYRIEP
jgi:hypothetical protein